MSREVPMTNPQKHPPRLKKKKGRRIDDFDSLIELWPAVLNRIRKKIGVTAVAYLHDARPIGFSDDEIVLEFSKEFHHAKATEASKRLPFEAKINETLDKPRRLKLQLAAPIAPAAPEVAPESPEDDDDDEDDDGRRHYRLRPKRLWRRHHGPFGVAEFGDAKRCNPSYALSGLTKLSCSISAGLAPPSNPCFPLEPLQIGRRTALAPPGDHPAKSRLASSKDYNLIVSSYLRNSRRPAMSSMVSIGVGV